MIFYVFSCNARDLGIQNVLDLDRVPLGKGLWMFEKQMIDFGGKCAEGGGITLIPSTLPTLPIYCLFFVCLGR